MSHQLASMIALALTVTIAGCGHPKTKGTRTKADIGGAENHEEQQSSGDAAPEPGAAPTGDDADTVSDGTAADPEAAETVAGIVTKTGVRNYEQIFATMSTVTGVPSTTAAVRNVFNNELTTSLPTNNDVKAFGASNQVAIFKLAVEFCDVLVNDQAARSKVFGAFNFAGTPTASLNAAGKTLVAESLINNFWGTGLSSLPPMATSSKIVTDLIDGLLVGKNMNAAPVTTAVVKGACAGVLSAAPVTMY